MCKPLATLLVVAFAASSISARAQVLSQPYYFDCDVPAGHSSEWNGTLSSETVEVAGFVQLIESRQDARWLPVASVFLVGPGETLRVGLQVVVSRDAPTELQVVVLGLEGADKRTVITSRSSDAGPLAFTMSLAKSGELKIVAAGASHTVELGRFKAAKLALSCSTGQFTFTSILVTR